MLGLRAVEFFRNVYADNGIRIEQKRSLVRDVALYLANASLAPIEAGLSWGPSSERPVIFIVGVPRSGSTVLSQFLVNHFDLAYPTNLSARFFMAPILGLAFAGRLARGEVSYSSNGGLTQGAASPHEYGWFWQYAFRHADDDELTPDALDRIDWRWLRRELMTLTGWARRPLLFKNLNYVDFKIERIARELPTALFIQTRRSTLDSAASILAWRMRRYGTYDAWWSIRPSGWRAMMDKSPVEQAVWQVMHTQQRVCEQVDALGPERVLTVDHATLVSAPQTILDELRAFFGARVHCTRAVAHFEAVERSGGSAFAREIAAAIERYGS